MEKMSILARLHALIRLDNGRSNALITSGCGCTEFLIHAKTSFFLNLVTQIFFQCIEQALLVDFELISKLWVQK